MRARWEALHASLVRSVRVLHVGSSFLAVTQHHPALAGFSDPETVVEHLTSKAGDGPTKDRILGALVTLVQRREHHELATALLWLGLWPGLDAIYRRRLRHFQGEPDELVAELARAFTERVARIDLAAVHRVAGTLVRSTERDLMDRRKRAWRETGDGVRVDLDPSPTDEEDDALGASWFDKASLLRWAASHDDSALGLTPGVSFEEDVVVLRAWLGSILDEDAELLLAVLVLDETQREAGARLGLAPDAARKRFQRALARLRTHVEKSLSRFGDADRFSLPRTR